MKSKIQKENIREMLNAERLGDAKSPWGDFKRKLSDEFLSSKVPPLEIATLPLNKGKGAGVGFRWLAPAFALFLIAGGFVIWHQQQNAGVKSALQVKHSTREFKKGDVFKSERREIRFLKGSADITQDAEKIRIATTTLTADFRLKQKVDMQIRHPLITVTITGTQFIFDATAKGGIIRLGEGSLAIDFHGVSGMPEKLSLKAPAQFTFSEKKYQSTSLKRHQSSGDKLLYRYDLVSGETFFAHQIQISAEYHRVELLGGKEQTIPVENIVRFVSAENP